MTAYACQQHLMTDDAYLRLLYSWEEIKAERYAQAEDQVFGSVGAKGKKNMSSLCRHMSKLIN